MSSQPYFLWSFVGITHPSGLGTSTSQEAKEYFSDMQRHRIPFKYSGPEDDDAITLVRSDHQSGDLQQNLLSFCQCNRHLQWSCEIWLSRPLAERRWRNVKSGWPTSWSTGVSAGNTTCLRWRDHGSLCSLSLVLSVELHGVFGVSSQDYLYGESTKFLSYNDFVNKELVLFSNSDNERSIPCLVDGGSESSAVTKNDSSI